jgi:hypothetical protein
MELRYLEGPLGKGPFRKKFAMSAAAAMYTQAEVDAKLAKLTADIADNAARSAQITTDADQGWIVICGAMVFFMQIGFGMLEAGAISKKNVQNILYKNFLDASGAAICYWLLGYGFAYGPTVGGFIGNVSGKSEAMQGSSGSQTHALRLNAPRYVHTHCTALLSRYLRRGSLRVLSRGGGGRDAGKWMGDFQTGGISNVHAS